MQAGSPEHLRYMRERWRFDIAEIERDLPNLPREERDLVLRVKTLTRDSSNAEEVRRIAYLPLGPLSPARQYAMAMCQLRGFGNLRGDRNPT